MPSDSKHSRYAGWLPSNPKVYKQFFDEILKEARSRQGDPDPDSPAGKFKQAIEKDQAMVELFEQIFNEVEYMPDVEGIRNFKELVDVIDIMVSSPPRVYVYEDENGKEKGEAIGVPLYLVFELLSSTSAGYILFNRYEFNVAMKALLGSWNEYLKDPKRDSNKTLTNEKTGWFGDIGLKSLEKNAGGKFNDVFVCPKPNEVNRGYQTWDEFFIRKFQKDKRPVHHNENDLIHNACESTVYRIATKVKEHDRFWLKGQPYSLYEMLNGDAERVKYFTGGTVYQAFLASIDFHRWHSPVNGTIEKVVKVESGTYFASLPDNGAEVGDPDLEPGDPRGVYIRCQSWLSANNVRAIYYIKANPAEDVDVGVVCFIAVGMVEVSTCEITVKEGDSVVKGQEIGMFHFGGSSHVLLFRPGIDINFADYVVPDTHIKINSVIARANPKPPGDEHST